MALEIKKIEDTTLYKSGSIRGYKFSYKNSIGYTVGLAWPKKEPDPDIIEQQQGCPAAEDENDMGVCIDIQGSEIDNILEVLNKMKDAPADFHEVDTEYEEFVKKREEEEKTLWWKIKDRLDDIGITFTPFFWKAHRLFVHRPMGEGKNKELCFKMCKGFCLGPFTITW